ncbi:MAG TPA: response regulator transcription factor [Caldilineaceae bacterium]|nr:response regulator transcription factor [Caldilineaceae bacterium]
MTHLRVLLVDDHLVVRLGLRALLESEPHIAIMGEAGTAADAVQLASQLQPDLVLMDIRLPDRSGISACQEIRQRWPQIQVIMLTSYADEELVLEAISAGAAGYVLKDLDAGELLRAIHAVAQGDALLDPSITQKVLARVRRAEHESQVAAFRALSERERQILMLVADGKTNAEIANELILSEKTVGNHVSAILSKLGVTNRIEAATYAVRHHLERHVSRRSSS